MLKRAIDYLVLAAVWMTLPAGAQSRQEAFRPVQGSNLSERLATVVKQSESDSVRTPFWTAYSFDVRTGVAVDIELTPEFQGRVVGFGDREVFFGTLNGVPVETRNLAIFMLHSPGSETITRLEIRNLDQRNRSDSYPVYWLGRATSDESFSQLRRLVEVGRSQEIKARATLALALHNDPGVGEILKDFVRNSKDAEVRAAAISWLGQLRTDSNFLAEVIRQASDTETQVQAVRAFAAKRDGDTFTTLQGCYQPDLNWKVKMALVDAIANDRDKEKAAAFLIDIAEHDPAPKIRQHVIYTLRRFPTPTSIDELMRLYRAEQGVSEKMQILFALSQMDNRQAEEKLFEVAGDSTNPRIRRQARFLLNDRIRQRLTRKGKPASRKAEADFEKVAERILRERSPSEAITLLTDTAKTDADPAVRVMAIFYLHQVDDPRVLSFYRELLSE